MTSKRVARDFGRYLQSCRRAGGISLEVVSHQTKITADNLRQIENERLELLPSPVFVKGFIKAFAKVVDGDPDEAICRFENCLAAKTPPCIEPVNTANRSFRGYHLILALVLFAALIGTTLWLADRFHHPQPAVQHASATASHAAPKMPATSPGKPAPPANPASTVSEKAPQPPDGGRAALRVASKPAIEPTPVPPLDETLALQMTAKETTWLKVVPDGLSPREFLLQADQSVTLKAERQFDLVIGNAGGIRLMLNDQPVPLAGENGQVVNLHLP